MDPSYDETASLYSVIAQTLPQEGRDYRIEFSRGESGRLSARLIPVNAMGRAWVPFVHRALGWAPKADAGDGTDGREMTYEEAVQRIRAAADTTTKKGQQR